MVRGVRLLGKREPCSFGTYLPLLHGKGIYRIFILLTMAAADRGFGESCRSVSPDGAKELRFRDIFEWRMNAYSAHFALHAGDTTVDFGALMVFGWGNYTCWSEDSRYFATPVLSGGLSVFVYDTQQAVCCILSSDFSHFRCELRAGRLFITGENGGTFELRQLPWRPFAGADAVPIPNAERLPEEQPRLGRGRASAVLQAACIGAAVLFPLLLLWFVLSDTGQSLSEHLDLKGGLYRRLYDREAEPPFDRAEFEAWETVVSFDRSFSVDMPSLLLERAAAAGALFAFSAGSVEVRVDRIDFLKDPVLSGLNIDELNEYVDFIQRDLIAASGGYSAETREEATVNVLRGVIFSYRTGIDSDERGWVSGYFAEGRFFYRICASTPYPLLDGAKCERIVRSFRLYRSL